MTENDIVPSASFWATASISTDSTSDPIDMRQHRHMSTELLQTGTLAGTATLQGSNTYNTKDATAAWTAVVDSAGSAVTLVLAGSTGEHPIKNVSDVNYAFLRWNFVRSGGTGTIKGVVARKN